MTSTADPPKKASGPKALWAKLKSIDLNPETAFAKKRPPPAPRTVYFNQPLPAEAFGKKGRPAPGWEYASNQVLTAKYTLYNFVFKNLLEQFRRIANLFFLLIVILQFFPQFSTINPGVSMLPLLAVLAITMAKDGYEDVKRHQSDRFINRLRVDSLVGGGWKNPNFTELKSRSVGSALRALRQKLPGGKKKTQAVQQQMRAPGPDGQVQDGQERQLLSTHALGRRATSGLSADDHEFEHTADGRVIHRGKVLSADEEHAYFARKKPRWKPKMWEDLAVGDFVILRNNDPIPADIVICATSEEEDTCFIETKNLDGETNLKARHAVPELSHLRDPQTCAAASFKVHSEPQSTNMYRLNGSVELSDTFDKNGKPLQCPITLNEVLLRGCNLRNTKWVVGIVLMTGVDSKIVANSGVTPSKRSKVEKQMNPMVYFNLGILALMAVVCAIADWWLEDYYFDRSAYWEYLAVYSDDNPRINGLVAFANSLITFQNIVPISLYISIEAVRTIQAYFIYDDYDIWYEKRNRRTTAKSWNLSDDLGQIEYIFSDKTGTLTQNMMIFRECAVGGIVYHGDRSVDRMEEEEAAAANSAAAAANGAGGGPGSADETAASFEKAGFASNPDTDHTSSTSSHDGRHPSEGAKGDNGGGGANVDSGARRTVRPSNADVPAFRDSRLSEDLSDRDGQQGVLLGRFFRCLGLCHTVLVEEHGGNVIEYQAQSPDEQALVQAAADVGYVFCGKDRSTLKLQVPDSSELERYELLTVNEFSSARKRMSVILRRHSDGQLLLFAKGADSIMFERSAAGQDDVKAGTDEALEEFANKGLRTLCLGYRELDAAYYDDWAHRFHEATVALEDREEAMEALASEIESELVLLGATAIEDKLQDGVPETIADLKRAGINVWVATGDKLETAIAIGYSTQLLTRDMNLVVVRGGEYGQPNSAYEQLRKAVVRFFGGREVLLSMEHQPPDAESQAGSRRSSFMSRRPSFHRNRRSSVSQASLVGEDNGQRPGGYALVIDGTALGHALSEEFSKDLLLKISTQCRAVICCRVSPLQKALIVRLIKDGLGVMTLAIGDGANDVSMIQAAHVGIGIAGEEGLQAVNSSDYAIAQFRFLKRLVLVHGHWSYWRNSVMIKNFFYKEFIQIGYLFWFQIYCAWSTTQAIDYIYLLFWNAVWTVAAVIFVGIFERDVNDKVLMQVPELYRRGREGRYFGLVPFLVYVAEGVYQSVVLYFFVAYAYDMTTSRSDGYDVDLYEWSATMLVASVFIANLFTGLDVRAWTWFMAIGIFFGPVVIAIFVPIYNAFKPSVFVTPSYGNNHYNYRSIQYYALCIFCTVLCLMPRFIWKHLRQFYYPTDIDILRYVDEQDPHHDFYNDPAIIDRTKEDVGSYDGHPPAPPPGAAAGPAATRRSADGIPMHALQQTASRASSTHYDMLTGLDRPNRGYTFSSDEPSRSAGDGSGGRSNSRRRRLSVKRLLPGPIQRTLRKRDDRRRLTAIEQEDDARDDADDDDEPAAGGGSVTPGEPQQQQRQQQH
ncbi:uncharacterized protein PFL1_05585 [Pseudozyma flocculosa PF-1]|uniref:Phospholipid-transporting ATPase n=1 Tax=Pseudozyma flocculosa PF-1 TaxID=1277687 RepID=A0A061H4Q3_9BASI|nr:uncharacterized protein PFL1_05585 [Pseudozyma flocculosa PF-1]EPQ26950.1 hypothetical protein PFL1_05585 [Pseudozyma flocculosa PF-1]